MTASGLRELLSGDPLNEREHEVLVGAAIGETVVQTGERIHLAPDTVKTYRKRITAKLNARNITHAVALAICIGEVNPDDVLPDDD